LSDELLRMLAERAGIQARWTDQRNIEQEVSPETLRAILQALSLPCTTPQDLRNTLSALEIGLDLRGQQDFITARVGQPVALPLNLPPGTLVEVQMENGALRSVASVEGFEAMLTLPPFDEPGYHLVRVADREITVAMAPARCIGIADLRGDGRAWGVSAQIYSLRRQSGGEIGDGGIGDFGAVSALARQAAALGADLLPISPVHALYAADARHYSPYSPSSRLFYNPLYGDPSSVFPEDFLRQAVADAGIDEEMQRLESLELVDWTAAGPLKYRLLRLLYERLQHLPDTLAAEFRRFEEQAPRLLQLHAAFETLHAEALAAPDPRWSWRDWPEAYRDPDGEGVAAFVREHADEVRFHTFLQWFAGKSYADCQRVCRESGMAVGLVADLAIGMDGSGSHAWSRQQDILTGLAIGAPPDFYNAEGQNWGLTGFSPRGLTATGFMPFIETLRAALRHAGGMRIDHAMGMNRLWLVPDGAVATAGAYLHYPSESLFRLIALESWRHKAIVIGEDLGTLPDGFRGYLDEQGISGMRVLRFERERDHFRRPDEWRPTSVGMTTTHDLVATAGWWAGSDLDPAPDGDLPPEHPHAVRAWDRGLLWAAFQQAGVAPGGERPAPQDTAPVVDASVRFLAKSGCAAKVLAIEDALGLEVQPNVPGTIDEKPNWRHRLDGPAQALLEPDAVRVRLEILALTAPRPQG
jgi:4-alpha-glucanotransferase